MWRTDLTAALSRCATLLGSVGRLAVSTSCALLHVPYDVEAETALDAGVRARLAFARQKMHEVVHLATALRDDGPQGRGVIAEASERAHRASATARNDRVRARISALRPGHRHRAPYPERAAAQRERLKLPLLATTTIGSFPRPPGFARRGRSGGPGGWTRPGIRSGCGPRSNG